MSGLFGKKTQAAQQPAPVAALRVQTSAFGKALPIIYGTTRSAPNILWYGDFTYTVVQNQPTSGGGGGGKGGLFGSKQQAQTSTSYEYSTSVAFGICEGPIVAFGQVYSSASVVGSLALAGLSAGFLGPYPQTPWTYLTTHHPGQDLGYNGIAYVAASSLQLGSNPGLPNYNFEVNGVFSNSVNGLDADPSLVVTDLMTNAHYGAGMPSSMLGDLSTYQNYTFAAGLLLSVAYVDQRAVSQMIDEIGLATNSAPVWNGTTFTMIPYGDQIITGNGKTYNPPTQPAFSLTDDDFVPNQGSGSSGSADDPIIVDRKRPADKINSVKVEYLNRANNYNPDIVEAKEQSLIDLYGIRQSPSAAAHMFASSTMAFASAQLALRRQLIANVFTFTVDARYAAIDPMDIVAITDSTLGLNAQWVRVTEITENDDDTFTIVAEEYLAGTGSAPLYSFQQGSGFQGNTEEAPGGIQPPIIFEPTAELLGTAGLEIWAGVCGVVPSTWGGAQVWVANSLTSDYKKVDTVIGAARMGTLSAGFGTVAVSNTGQTIDITNTLSVDLTESLGILVSGTQVDATNLNTLCFVDGEYVAYQTATLTATSKYNLTYLVRGALGTEDNVVTHNAGSNFLRLDNGILKIPYRQDQIGTTVYLKFLSFNVYGGGLQALSDVSPVAYAITGLALTSPLPTVQNVRPQITDLFMYIYWDDVSDFRNGIRYKIYKGASFAGAQQVGDNAHAPFIAFGADTYWIVAYCQPVPGLLVYSEAPVSITIAGNMLTKNIVLTSDQQAEGWPGVFSNGVGKDGTSIRLGGAGNILGVADFLNLPDVLNYGGIIASGTYEINSLDIVNVGYVADCYVNASWKCTGVPVGQNILTLTDFLNQPDILGSASTKFVDAKVQIATAQSAASDLYVPPDLYAIGDLYGWYSGWSDWTDFVPGVYRAQLIKFRLVLTTTDAQTICYVLAFSYTVSVKPRIDHYQNVNVLAGGHTITFEPDDASAAAAFNGGPQLGGVGNATLPYINFSWVGSAGLVPIIDTLTLSTLTFHFVDGSGTPTAVSSVNVTAEGY